MSDNSTAELIQRANHTMRQGHLQEALDLLQPAITQPPADQTDHLSLLLAYGDLLTLAIFYLSGDPDAPRAQFEQARDLAVAQGDETARAAALDGLGLTHYYQQLPLPDRDFGAALALFEQALALAENGNDDLVLSNVHFHLGLVAQMSGDNETARPHFEKTATLAAEHPIERSEAVRHLGFLAYMQDDFETAEKHLAESLRLREEADYQMGLAFAHLSLGDAILQLERVDEAMQHFETAIDFGQKLANKRVVALCWLSIGEAYEKLDDSAQARDAYEKALAGAREVGHVMAENMAAERLEVLSEDGGADSPA